MVVCTMICLNYELNYPGDLNSLPLPALARREEPGCVFQQVVGTAVKQSYFKLESSSAAAHAPTPTSIVSRGEGSIGSAPYDSVDCASGVPTVTAVDDGSFGPWRGEEGGGTDLAVYQPEFGFRNEILEIPFGRRCFLRIFVGWHVDSMVTCDRCNTA
jgi:hypothetical protein